MALINRKTLVPGVVITDTTRPVLRDFAAELRVYSELYAWWDFNAARITPDTSTTPGSTRVQAVADKSGHSRGLTTASSAKRPLWVPNVINGRAVARFDEVAGHRLDGVGKFPTSGDHTKVVVSKLAASASNAVRFLAGTISPGANGHQLGHTTAQRAFARNAITSTAIQPTIGSSEQLWQSYILAQDVAGNAAYLKIGNIMDVIAATMTVTTTQGDIYIGQTGSNTQSYGGDIAEVMVFACNLLAPGYAALLALVQAYLADAYGDL